MEAVAIVIGVKRTEASNSEARKPAKNPRLVAVLVAAMAVARLPVVERDGGASLAVAPREVCVENLARTLAETPTHNLAQTLAENLPKTIRRSHKNKATQNNSTIGNTLFHKKDKKKDKV